MHIVTVIPLSRGIGVEELTYFTSSPIAPGHLVDVPLRRRSVPALVVRATPVREEKAYLKSSGFTLREVSRIYPKPILLESFLKAAENIARYHATTTGAVLNTLIPKHIIPILPTLSLASKESGVPRTYEASVLQDDFETRVGHHKALIRESFARGEAVFLLVPTVKDAELFSDALSHGIEHRTISLHSNLSRAKTLERWRSATASDAPMLIIGTIQNISIPRRDIGVILVEGEGSPVYKDSARPFLDARTVAEFFAKEKNTLLIYSDVLLRSSTFSRYQFRELSARAQPKARYESAVSCRVIEHRQEGKAAFQAVTNEVKTLLAHTASHPEQMFVFTARKGLFPATVCKDCGQTVTCASCTSPMVIYRKGNERIYACNHCGAERDTAVTCSHCGSWNLVPLGIGIERVEEEIAREFPHERFRLDATHANTHREAERIIASWKATKNGILFGTERALPYLGRVPHVVVASLDTFFEIPDVAMHEKIFRIILTLRRTAHKTLLIQTRAAHHPVLAHACNGAVREFAKEDLADRHALGYPPSRTLVKITITGSPAHVEKTIARVRDTLAPYSLHTFPALHHIIQKRFVLHGLIALPRGQWVDETLLLKLRSLPHDVAVDVDPQSLV